MPESQPESAPDERTSGSSAWPKAFGPVTASRKYGRLIQRTDGYGRSVSNFN
ncbi:MAG: hypothetical protein LBP22_02065 [Deltaproteobacteria bacterium]|nr:hypothetical protein [Deltaproteobacteria bacterium]